MIKDVKIILTSGISITINEKDKVAITTCDGDKYLAYDIKDIKDIPSIIMDAKKIIIHHSISTGEYMEYYLTRDKITWCYYSEIPEKNKK